MNRRNRAVVRKIRAEAMANLSIREGISFGEKSSRGRGGGISDRAEVNVCCVIQPAETVGGTADRAEINVCCVIQPTEIVDGIAYQWWQEY